MNNIMNVEPGMLLRFPNDITTWILPLHSGTNRYVMLRPKIAYVVGVVADRKPRFNTLQITMISTDGEIGTIEFHRDSSMVKCEILNHGT